MKIFYNNNIVNPHDISISPFSKGFCYGEGFFTTIKVLNKRGINIKYHNKRILEGISYFNFKIATPDLELIISKIANNCNMPNFRLKVIIYMDVESVGIMAIPEELPIRVKSMELEKSIFYRDNNPIHKIKSLNYYSNLKNSASIITDVNNIVLETGFANIFAIKDNLIFTPPSSYPLLNGTYRQYLLNMKNIDKFKIIERPFNYNDLFIFDGIFITNAIRGIIPVSKIDSQNIPTDLSINIKNLIP